MEKVVERIPTWALRYIINGDPSGIDVDDIAKVDDFLKSYEKMGCHIQIVSPIVEDENAVPQAYFSHYPAFGLPCEVVDCEVLFTKTDSHDN